MINGYDVTFDHQRRLFGPTDEPLVDDPMKGRLKTPRAVKDFALLGNAYLTIRSLKTGQRFTYRVSRPRQPDHMRRPIWFVAALTGPDNESHYTYIGQVYEDLRFAHGRKSPIERVTPVVQAFDWTWNNVVRLEKEKLMTELLEVWHEGRCGRCGRRLTVPESVARGIGPECVKHVEG